MAWEAHVKVTMSMIDSGDLPRGTVEDYVRLGRLAMALREVRRGDTFTAANSAVAKALDVGGWANGKRRLEKLARLTPLIRWREVDDTKVEITLPGFEKRQGFIRPATEGALSTPRPTGQRGGQPEARGGARGRPGGGPRGGPGIANPRETLRSVKNASCLQTPDTRQQDSRGNGSELSLGSEGEEFTNTLPSAVLEQVRAGRRWLDPSVQRLVDDDAFLEDEWRRCVAHHRKVGTRPKLVAAVFNQWLKDRRTGERAHEYLKAETERVAVELSAPDEATEARVACID
jgi:hypothetical protein